MSPTLTEPQEASVTQASGVRETANSDLTIILDGPSGHVVQTTQVASSQTHTSLFSRPSRVADQAAPRMPRASELRRRSLHGLGPIPGR